MFYQFVWKCVGREGSYQGISASAVDLTQFPLHTSTFKNDEIEFIVTRPSFQLFHEWQRISAETIENVKPNATPQDYREGMPCFPGPEMNITSDKNLLPIYPSCDTLVNTTLLVMNEAEDYINLIDQAANKSYPQTNSAELHYSLLNRVKNLKEYIPSGVTQNNISKHIESLHNFNFSRAVSHDSTQSDSLAICNYLDVDNYDGLNSDLKARKIGKILCDMESICDYTAFQSELLACFSKFDLGLNVTEDLYKEASNMTVDELIPFLVSTRNAAKMKSLPKFKFSKTPTSNKDWTTRGIDQTSLSSQSSRERRTVRPTQPTPQNTKHLEVSSHSTTTTRHESTDAAKLVSHLNTTRNPSEANDGAVRRIEEALLASNRSGNNSSSDLESLIQEPNIAKLLPAGMLEKIKNGNVSAPEIERIIKDKATPDTFKHLKDNNGSMEHVSELVNQLHNPTKYHRDICENFDNVDSDFITYFNDNAFEIPNLEEKMNMDVQSIGTKLESMDSETVKKVCYLLFGDNDTLSIIRNHHEESRSIDNSSMVSNRNQYHEKTTRKPVSLEEVSLANNGSSNISSTLESINNFDSTLNNVLLTPSIVKLLPADLLEKVKNGNVSTSEIENIIEENNGSISDIVEHLKGNNGSLEHISNLVDSKLICENFDKDKIDGKLVEQLINTSNEIRMIVDKLNLDVNDIAKTIRSMDKKMLQEVCYLLFPNSNQIDSRSHHESINAIARALLANNQSDDISLILEMMNDSNSTLDNLLEMPNIAELLPSDVKEMIKNGNLSIPEIEGKMMENNRSLSEIMDFLTGNNGSKIDNQSPSPPVYEKLICDNVDGTMIGQWMNTSDEVRNMVGKMGLNIADIASKIGSMDPKTLRRLCYLLFPVISKLSSKDSQGSISAIAATVLAKNQSDGINSILQMLNNSNSTSNPLQNLSGLASLLPADVLNQIKNNNMTTSDVAALIMSNNGSTQDIGSDSNKARENHGGLGSIAGSLLAGIGLNKVTSYLGSNTDILQKILPDALVNKIKNLSSPDSKVKTMELNETQSGIPNRMKRDNQTTVFYSGKDSRNCSNSTSEGRHQKPNPDEIDFILESIGKNSTSNISADDLDKIKNGTFTVADVITMIKKNNDKKLNFSGNFNESSSRERHGSDRTTAASTFDRNSSDSISSILEMLNKSSSPSKVIMQHPELVKMLPQGVLEKVQNGNLSAADIETLIKENEREASKSIGKNRNASKDTVKAIAETLLANNGKNNISSILEMVNNSTSSSNNLLLTPDIAKLLPADLSEKVKNGNVSTSEIEKIIKENSGAVQRVAETSNKSLAESILANNGSGSIASILEMLNNSNSTSNNLLQVPGLASFLPADVLDQVRNGNVSASEVEKMIKENIEKEHTIFNKVSNSSSEKQREASRAVAEALLANNSSLSAASILELVKKSSSTSNNLILNPDIAKLLPVSLLDDVKNGNLSTAEIETMIKENEGDASKSFGKNRNASEDTVKAIAETLLDNIGQNNISSVLDMVKNSSSSSNNLLLTPDIAKLLPAGLSEKVKNENVSETEVEKMIKENIGKGPTVLDKIHDSSSDENQKTVKAVAEALLVNNGTMDTTSILELVKNSSSASNSLLLTPDIVKLLPANLIDTIKNGNVSASEIEKIIKDNNGKVQEDVETIKSLNTTIDKSQLTKNRSESINSILDMLNKPNSTSSDLLQVPGLASVLSADVLNEIKNGSISTAEIKKMIKENNGTISTSDENQKTVKAVAEALLANNRSIDTTSILELVKKSSSSSNNLLLTPDVVKILPADLSEKIKNENVSVFEVEKIIKENSGAVQKIADTIKSSNSSLAESLLPANQSEPITSILEMLSKSNSTPNNLLQVPGLAGVLPADALDKLKNGNVSASEVEKMIKENNHTTAKLSTNSSSSDGNRESVRTIAETLLANNQSSSILNNANLENLLPEGLMNKIKKDNISTPDIEAEVMKMKDSSHGTTRTTDQTHTTSKKPIDASSTTENPATTSLPIRNMQNMLNLTSIPNIEQLVKDQSTNSNSNQNAMLSQLASKVNLTNVSSTDLLAELSKSKQASDILGQLDMSSIPSLSNLFG